jgi:hypothetical protein
MTDKRGFFHRCGAPYSQPFKNALPHHLAGGKERAKDFA